jgi:parallel beta-helix repeat protein
MANTYVDYTAVASQTDYNFSFEYLRDEHVKVKVNGTLVTNYTIVTSPTPTKIRFNTAPVAGSAIKIYRDSRGDFSPLVDFVNGSVLTESELDESYKHNLFVSQESSEGTGGEQLTKKGLTNYDAEGNKIINLGTPTDNTDTANKAYVDQTIDNSIALGGSPAIVSLGGYNVTALGTTAARSLANRFEERVSVKDYGATGNGTTDDTDAIQAALNSENSIYFPEGTYKVTYDPNAVIAGGFSVSVEYMIVSVGTTDFTLIGADNNNVGTIFTATGVGTGTGTAKPTGHGLLINAVNKHIKGAGLELANIVYTSSTSNSPAIKITSDDVHIEGLLINGNANATKTTEPTPNCIGLEFIDVSECSVRNCQVIGGHFGIRFDNTTTNPDNNSHNIVEGCILRNQFSTGVIIQGGQYTLIQGNNAEDCGSDGFKVKEGSQRNRILGNTARANGRDGFDVYDGFIDTILDGNLAEDNALQGFEIKGTFDGTYGAGDYVARESVISNNIAVSNGSNGSYDGFSIISVRNTTITGNSSISSTANGFAFNTIQGCTVTGNSSSRNTKHGFDFQSSVSRLLVSGCYAVDNSWADGSTQNGTYNGFNIQSGCAVQFSSCHSINGTTTSKKGGQGYGFYWEAVSSGSTLIGCYTLGNVTDGVGGVSGFSTNNGIFNTVDNGSFRGIQFKNDAMDELEVKNASLELTADTASFNELSIVDGITAPSARTGKAQIYVDTADGDLKVIFSDGTVKTIVVDT